MIKTTIFCMFGSVFGFAATTFAQADTATTEAAPAEVGASVSTPTAEPGKFVLGLRLGYGLPMGDMTKGTSLSDGISGMLPLWLDVGYNITPNIMVGLYGQYGIVFINDCPSGADCPASDIRFGVQGQYHVSPMEKLDPWLGLGVGYEMLSVKQSADGAEVSVGLKGMEYLNLQAGADFKLSPAFGLGPFMSFSLGQYGTASAKSYGMADAGIPDMDRSVDVPSAQKAIHEWLTLGVRGAFNL